MDLIKKYLMELLEQMEKGEKTPQQVAELSQQISVALESIDVNDPQEVSNIIKNIGLSA